MILISLVLRAFYFQLRRRGDRLSQYRHKALTAATLLCPQTQSEMAEFGRMSFDSTCNPSKTNRKRLKDVCVAGIFDIKLTMEVRSRTCSLRWVGST